MDQTNNTYLADIWIMLDSRMRETYQYTEESYELWFGRMKLSYLDADKAVFVCENETKRGIISKRFLDFISASMEDVIGYAPAVSVEVDTSLAPPVQNYRIPSQSSFIPGRSAFSAQEPSPADAPSGKEWSQPQAPNLAAQAQPDSAAAEEAPRDDGIRRTVYNSDENAGPVSVSGSGSGSGAGQENAAVRGERRLAYNPDYTFENFIVGTSNRFAHAAAMNVADNIGTKVNPLFIWGPPGLGKTHLMYAIANRALKRNSDMKVIYIKGEEFTNQLVEAIRHDRNQQFRQKYRSCDILLIDDIQFIAGKEATQNEFFHTFDALYEDKKQIILTSDRPPKELTALEDRIRSRFEAGLLADIKPPDYELRLAILRNKIGQNHISVPQDVVDFLAQNLQENIRQLDGVIKKLAMANLLTGQPINMEMVLATVPEYLRDAEPVSDTVDRIIACVARHYKTTVEDIMGTSRKKEIKTARNVAMYVVRSVTGMSFPQIGVVFDRDHSTVHSNVNMIENELVSDPVLEAKIGEITKEIKHS